MPQTRHRREFTIRDQLRNDSSDGEIDAPDLATLPPKGNKMRFQLTRRHSQYLEVWISTLAMMTRRTAIVGSCCPVVENCGNKIMGKEM
jgi:hypothetical protein